MSVTTTKAYRKYTRYLVVASDGEGTILQLFGWKVQQNVGNKSRNIRSGGEGNLLVAVTTNGYLPARDIKVEDPLNLRSDGWNSQSKRYIKRLTTSKCNPGMGQCRRRHMACSKLSAGPELLPSHCVCSQSLLSLFLQTLKERTI